MSGRFKAGLVLCVTVALGTCATPPSLLDEVRSTKTLRVVTYEGPNTVYQTRDNELAGPEYDLLKGFANSLGVRLELVHVAGPAEVIPALAGGRAHMAAAGLTISTETERRVEFGPTYQQVTEHLVYREGRRRPKDVSQLRGKRLEVPSGSSYAKTLARTQARHPELIFTENPHATQPELLNRVAAGQLDYTVVKSNAYALYRGYLPQLRVAFNLAEGESLAWAFPRRGDGSLREAADRYFGKIRANGELDRTLDHYYGHGTLRQVGTRQYALDVERKLPRWRKLFELAADANALDWRLLAAIGYQESQWDPDAVSPTGVRGLMMLTEETARIYGVIDRTNPSQSVAGGARLFANLMKKLPATIQEPDRTWFALAAYNIGIGHLFDARRITRARGGDWNKWDDVRPSIRLLADPEFAAKTRHGYARGGETLHFVNNVRQYYSALQWLTREPGDDSIWIQQRSAPPVIQADAADPGATPRG